MKLHVEFVGETIVLQTTFQVHLRLLSVHHLHSKLHSQTRNGERVRLQLHIPKQRFHQLRLNAFSMVSHHLTPYNRAATPPHHHTHFALAELCVRCCVCVYNQYSCIIKFVLVCVSVCMCMCMCMRYVCPCACQRIRLCVVRLCLCQRHYLGLRFEGLRFVKVRVGLEVGRGWR